MKTERASNFTHLLLMLILLAFALSTTAGPSSNAFQDASQSRVFVGHTDTIIALAVSPDSRFIASGSYDHTVRLWDVASAREIRRYTLTECDPIQRVVFSPDGRFVLLSCGGFASPGIRVWDTATGREVRHFGEGNFESFSADARFVINQELGGSHLGGQICVWNVETGKEAVCFANTRRVVSSALSSDGHWVVAGDDNGPVRLWDVKSGRLIRRFIGNTEQVNSVTFSADGQRIAAGYCDGSTRVWQAQSGREIRRLVGPKRPAGEGCPLFGVALSPNGRSVLVSFFDKSLRLWDVENGRVIRNFNGHTGDISSIEFSPDGRFALSGSHDKSIRLWILAE